MKSKKKIFFYLFKLTFSLSKCHSIQ